MLIENHIISLARSNSYLIKQIVDIIDDDWGYRAKGKSSKTRVNKTINELKDSDLVNVNTDGLVLWIGE